MDDPTAGVRLWWTWLCGVSMINMVVLARCWVRHARNAARLDADAFRLQRRLLALSAVFVLGCAFRSFFPRADVQRIVLVDSWLSSVVVGRTVATAAELAFAAQWALVLGAFARAAGLGHLVALARTIVPAIAIAEVFSWAGVLTTNNLWHVFEESTWASCEVLLTLATLILWRRYSGRPRRFMGWMAFCSAMAVMFMFTVDVPTYVHRWRADTAAGKATMGLAEGFRDIATRWRMTFDGQDWQGELAWMALYFSVAVWLSLAFTAAPLGDLEKEASPSARAARADAARAQG